MPSIPLWINSDPASGSQNLSASGNQFQTAFQPSINIPTKCRNPRIAVVSASVWWTVQNVLAGVNDQFVFTDDVAAPTKYSFTLPPGLYGIADIQSAISTLCVQAGLPGGIFTFSGVAATQHSTLTINLAGYMWNNTVAHSVGLPSPGLLGFSNQLLPNGSLTVAATTFTSDNVANFSSISSFQIQSSSFGGGLVFNGNASNALCNVPINVGPGQQITVEFQSLLWCPLNRLKGASIANSLWTLTDQNGNSVNTNSEFWQARLILEWDDSDDVLSNILFAIQKFEQTVTSIVSPIMNRVQQAVDKLSMVGDMLGKTGDMFGNLLQRRKAN